MAIEASNPDIIAGLKKETSLRCWIGLFYPESTKPDWQKILENNCVCCAVSPVHDRDVWDEAGEDSLGNKHEIGDKKKPHRHIVLYFNGKKNYDQVYEILKLIALDPDHCPPPKRPKGDKQREVQYLVHYNNKDKAPYLRSDIISINGFDVDRCFMLNSEQEAELYDAVLQLIIDNNVIEYWDLVMRLRILQHTEQIYEELHRYVRNHTILITNLLKSRRFSEHKDGVFGGDSDA